MCIREFKREYRRAVIIHLTLSSFPLPLQAREPKAVMKINTLNATFQPTKIGNAHGLQITYLKDNSTRNIFVYHEDGKVSHSCSVCPVWWKLKSTKLRTEDSGRARTGACLPPVEIICNYKLVFVFFKVVFSVLKANLQMTLPYSYSCKS